MIRWKFFSFLLCALMIPGLISTVALANESPVPTEPDPLLSGLSDSEVLQLGERMYRDGILPSGNVMEAFAYGNIRVDSTAFSCAHCHQRAGLGSLEGGIETPPTTGRKLYKPYRRPPSLNDVADVNGRYTYAKTIIHRPAYTRETLKKALRQGEDPTGEAFNLIMPQYPLADRDLAILVRYLELLSSEDSPGARIAGYKFATIISDDVSAEDREALLVPLRRFVAGQNKQVDMYRDFLKYGYKPTGDMVDAFRTAELKVWDLKGEPATWAKQLAAYYQADPVFAVLGGISHQSWQPIHDFCEAQQLPCLYPITNLPVVSAPNWYTLYFNKGYFQEGEAAEHFLKQQGDADSTILQLVQDSAAGRALAAGFSASRKIRGKAAVETQFLSPQQLQDPLALTALVAQKQPDVLLFWADKQMLPNLNAVASELDASLKIFVSSTLLGAATVEIPDNLRGQVFITYPYRLKPYFGDEEGFGFLAPRAIETTYKNFADRRISTRTAIMLNQSVIQGLRLLYNNLYRDYMLDVMGMQMDQVVPDYERISFGPGQRYASKGCYILQLGPGPEPELLPRSEWVIR